jgi:hypothetical protein
MRRWLLSPLCLVRGHRLTIHRDRYGDAVIARDLCTVCGTCFSMWLETDCEPETG